MSDMKLTTLCYLTRGEDILFMVKGVTSKNIANMNAGKYLGVGGHLEEGESAYECALREIYEETGIESREIKGFGLKGMASFFNDSCDDEVMYIYKGEYTGTREICPGTCDEGVLTWVHRKDIQSIPTWEGDREIFRLLFDEERAGVFELKLKYSGNDLVSSETYG